MNVVLSRRVWFGVIIAAALFNGLGAPNAAQAADRVPAEQSMQHGSNFFSMGRFEQAIEEWEAAAASYRETGDVDSEVIARVQMTEAYSALGLYLEAAQTLEDAGELLAKVDRPGLQLSVTSNLGNIYLLSGDFDAAQETLISSIKQAEALKNDAVLAAVHNTLGNLYVKQKRPRKALVQYRRAVSVARRSGDKEVETRATINQARNLIDLKRNKAALPLLQHAGDLLAPLENSHHKAYGLVTLGRLYSVAGKDSAQAEKFLKQGGRVAQAIYDAHAHSYSLGYLAELYEGEQRLDKALKLTQLAIRDAQQINARELLYRWQWQQARLITQLGKPEQAIAAYQSAVKSLQSARRSLGAERVNNHAFFDTAGRLYSDFAAMLLEQSDRAGDDKQRRKYLLAARDVIETQKEAEFRGYNRKTRIDQLPSASKQPEQLKKGTAEIYSVLLPQRLELLVTLPQGPKRFVVDIDADMLISQVRILRKLLAKENPQLYLPYAQKLYQWLFSPLEETLVAHDIGTVVIVPDSALHDVPMASLHDGQEFLIQRFNVATLPGLAGSTVDDQAQRAIAVLR